MVIIPPFSIISLQIYGNEKFTRQWFSPVLQSKIPNVFIITIIINIA